MTKAGLAVRSPAAGPVPAAGRVPAAGLTVPTRRGLAAGWGLGEMARPTLQATLRLPGSWLQWVAMTR